LIRSGWRGPILTWLGSCIEDLAEQARPLVMLVHDLAMRGVRGRLVRLLLE